MARVRGPLMSVDAVGTFGGDMRFRHNIGKVLVYRDGAPGSVSKKPRTTGQAAQRDKYSAAKDAWWALTEPQRQAWRDTAKAEGKNLTGWNTFLSSFLLAAVVPPGPYVPPPLVVTIGFGAVYVPPPLSTTIQIP